MMNCVCSQSNFIFNIENSRTKYCPKCYIIRLTKAQWEGMKQSIRDEFLLTPEQLIENDLIIDQMAYYDQPV